MIPRVDYGDSVPELLPARMLNEYAYCPRLAYLMWVESEFDHNAFTLDGRRVHARVDSGPQALPEADEAQEGEETEDAEPAESIRARSVMLSAPTEGLIAKIDLVELEGQVATPVDYKRSKKPDTSQGAWEPERVQLCAQGLILRENGYQSDRGVLYFAGSKERVEIDFTAGLIERTRELVLEFRRVAAIPERPAPLHESPKCGGCSLVAICLPEETARLQAEGEPTEAEMRRLLPARDDALPLYVQTHGMQVGKQGEVLVVKEKGSVRAEAKLVTTSQVCLFGNIGITAQALHECCDRGIPVCHFQASGWFHGITTGLGPRNAMARRIQFRAADNPAICLAVARRIASAKIQNQRTMLRRNHPEPLLLDLRALDEQAEAASRAESLESLLGHEGSAARIYFGAFPGLLKPKVEAGFEFDFEGRNRRPPRDPVNAMLSFAYAMLAKDCTTTLLGVGLDPHVGFYHQPRFGRPALALDLMEEFRPLVADSVVLTLVNNGIVAPDGFLKVGRSAAMKPKTQKVLIEAYERRMDQLVTHPVFGYRVSYRRTLEVQARLLTRHLAGEIPNWPPFLPR